jgi:hypothetical protein
MNVAAVATLCEGLSSYAAIAAAYCFARPSIRDQQFREIDDSLSPLAETHPDGDVRDLMVDLRERVRAAHAATIRPHKQWNVSGFLLLVISAVLLGAAIAIHIAND